MRRAAQSRVNAVTCMTCLHGLPLDVCLKTCRLCSTEELGKTAKAATIQLFQRQRALPPPSQVAFDTVSPFCIWLLQHHLCAMWARCGEDAQQLLTGRFQAASPVHLTPSLPSVRPALQPLRNKLEAQQQDLQLELAPASSRMRGWLPRVMLDKLAACAEGGGAAAAGHEQPSPHL